MTEQMCIDLPIRAKQTTHVCCYIVGVYFRLCFGPQTISLCFSVGCVTNEFFQVNFFERSGNLCNYSQIKYFIIFLLNSLRNCRSVLLCGSRVTFNLHRNILIIYLHIYIYQQTQWIHIHYTLRDRGICMYMTINLNSYLQH